MGKAGEIGKDKRGRGAESVPRRDFGMNFVVLKLKNRSAVNAKAWWAHQGSNLDPMIKVSKVAAAAI